MLATDIQTGTDCRDLPYDDGEIDCVVLDPPYMHTPGGSAHAVHTAFERHYRNNGTGNKTKKKYHEAVLSLYEDAGQEAHRVLRDRGVLIVKCQDEVCSNRQRFTHVEIMQAYAQLGFIAEDLFVVVRRNRPGVSRTVRQVHARKNHSYFLVFWKQAGGNLWEGTKVNPVELLVEIIREQAPKDIWRDSPLVGYRMLGNTNRGEIGEEFVRRYLAAHSIETGNGGRTSETDIRVGGLRFEVKTASLGANGTFQFNHVRRDKKMELPAVSRHLP